MFSVAFESCHIHLINSLAPRGMCLSRRWKFLQERGTPRAVPGATGCVQTSPKTLIAALVPLSSGLLELLKLMNGEHGWNAVMLLLALID